MFSGPFSFPFIYSLTCIYGCSFYSWVLSKTLAVIYLFVKIDKLWRLSVVGKIVRPNLLLLTVKALPTTYAQFPHIFATFETSRTFCNGFLVAIRRCFAKYWRHFSYSMCLSYSSYFLFIVHLKPTASLFYRRSLWSLTFKFLPSNEYSSILTFKRYKREYESDLRSYEHYLSSSENKAWGKKKKFKPQLAC